MDFDEVMWLRGGVVCFYFCGFFCFFYDVDINDYLVQVEDGYKLELNVVGLLLGDDVIDFDLDDFDDEFRGDVDGGEDENDVDIVFCVYDKVCCCVIIFFCGQLYMLIVCFCGNRFKE